MKHALRLPSAFFIAISLLLALPAAAAPVADVSLGTVQVEWQPTGDFAGMKLRVSGPLGVVEREFAADENPLFDLRTLPAVADGLYTWELIAAPRLDAGVRRAMAEARAEGDEGAAGRLRASGELPEAGSLVQSGHFTVSAGAIVVPSGEPEAAPAALRRVTSDAASGAARRVAAADQVIPDDLIVQGSVCVGFDCVNNESFGFDTIRLKENNTRIKFEDTSVGSFPSNDWQLTANDSASGGANKFSIEDITGAKVPFTLTAGAATNSIFVDSTGRVGFRTSTPVLDLHVATSNTPAIRLEQNNAGGFTAQTWDVAGNEANFFVRDITGGSLLPFRIRPGAPTSSIDVSADGDVGIGTTSGSGLQVNTAVSETADGNDNIRFGVAGGTPRAIFEDTGFQQWQIDNFNGDFRWFTPGVVRMIIEDDGDLGIGVSSVAAGNDIQHSNGAALTTGGVWADASSRSYKQEIERLDAAEAMRAFEQLVPVSYRYKQDPEEPYVGFIAEDVPDLVAMPGRKNLAAIEVVALLTKVVQQQQLQLDGLSSENKELRSLINDLLVDRQEGPARQ